MRNLAYPEIRLSEETVQVYQSPTQAERFIQPSEKTNIFYKKAIKSNHYDPSRSKDGLRVDEITFWTAYYEDPDFRYEWNNGVLEEKPMASINECLCSTWFIMIITEFLKAKHINHIIVNDIGFKLNLPGNSVIRRPDHALILGNNVYKCDRDSRSYKGIYDICIESLSHSTQQFIDRDTVQKKREYCQGRVKEYYIIDQKEKYTAFYRLNRNGNYSKLNPKDNIIRSTVLKGFQFRIKDIYEQPDLKTLINDPVYQSFVALDLQQERKAKEEERKAKENERKAKEEALMLVDQERKAKEEALAIAEQALMAKKKLEQKLKDKGIEI